VEDKMGIRASHTAEVILDDCRVPDANLLGGEKTSWIGAMKTLEMSRPVVASGSIGVARAAYEYALAYARERKAFGKPIAMHQSIAFMLADMKTAIEAARLLVWKAAWMADNEMPANKDAAIAKLFAADMGMQVTTDAVQIVGGSGYMKDLPVEKWMRDAKVFQIWEGTSQIQRLVISREEIGEL
ncbi:MAG: acyl-CoA dehydrogenase family protein, partial [Thermoplasmata archaeon]